MRDTALPFDDRGLAYGDGLFETVLVRDGQPLLWEYHMARLRQGVERLSLP
ncbi:MAG: aminotransferase class IV, partial [Pseudomonadota bacterium]|nr:aminotransferase class IV [Pseudomonadota bacterium]